jgi:mannonate dehydratase
VLPLPNAGAQSGSDIYTSNSLIRALCRTHPRRFLFGASVHPYRPDALAAIDEVFRAGACLIKWLPLHHNIDAADARTRAALRKCAALGLPVLIHMSEEFTLTTQCPQHRSIRPLLATLRHLKREDCMPPVIVAHVATPVTPWGDRDDYELLIEALMGEFRDAPLYADISALLAVTKARFLRAIALRQDLHHKLLFGSDFPVPVGVWALRRRLGRAYRELRGIRSWPQQAARACQTLGLNEIVFHRAATLLPNVRHFAEAQTFPS